MRSELTIEHPAASDAIFGWDAMLPRGRRREPEARAHPLAPTTGGGRSAAGAGRGLDTPAMEAVHRSLLGHYGAELARQALNREQMRLDEAMYDGDQWTAEELAVLERRGQEPLTFNLVAPAINWCLGTERRNPMDYVVLPRHEDGAAAAKTKGEYLKYLRDINHASVHESAAFKEVLCAGASFLEAALLDDGQGEPITIGHESWRNVLWDSTCRDPFLDSARYLFRTRWADADAMLALTPERADVIAASVESTLGGGWGVDASGDEAMDSAETAYQERDGPFHSGRWNHARHRLRVIEAWYRRTVQAEVLDGGDFRGELFDPWSRGHVRDISRGRASVVRRARRVLFVALLTNRGLLYHGPSPYRHNRFPLTPVWCYRRADDGLPYGMIRNLRSIQRDLNKRRTKALHILASRKVLFPRGAFGARATDVERAREEFASPDAMLEYDPTKGVPQDISDTNLVPAHTALMAEDAAMIESVSGVTNELMGRETNATSGLAIQRRQTQGQTTTAPIYENLRVARIRSGENLVSLVEQHQDRPTAFRLTDARGNPDYRAMNATPNGPDDVTLFKADFVIDERAAQATFRQAEAQLLTEIVMQIAQTAPEVVVGTLDLVVEMLDVPHRDELVKRIRQLTGASDPDADPADPEVQAQAQAKEAQAALAQRAQEAEIAHREAQVRKLLADASRAAAQAVAEERGLSHDEVRALREAVESATVLAGRPDMARLAQAIVADAAERAGQMAAAPDAAPAAPPTEAAAAMAAPPPAPAPPEGAPSAGPAGPASPGPASPVPTAPVPF